MIKLIFEAIYNWLIHEEKVHVKSFSIVLDEFILICLQSYKFWIHFWEIYSKITDNKIFLS